MGSGIVQVAAVSGINVVLDDISEEFSKRMTRKGEETLHHKAMTVHSTVKDPELIQQRRRQIVAAGVKLFQEKGFHKTTTREIAREAGFSIGTLYEYIESKEDVLYLVCQYIHDRVEERLREMLPDGDTARRTLEKAITAYFQVMDEMQGEVLLIYQEAQSLAREALHHVLQREEEITGIFADILRRGLEDGTLSVPEENIPLLAHDIIVLGEMWAFRRWALGRRYTLESYVQHQLSLLLPVGRENRASCSKTRMKGAEDREYGDSV